MGGFKTPPNLPNPPPPLSGGETGEECLHLHGVGCCLP